MYAAIRDGNTAVLGTLLSGGADVNAKERRGGATPLMLAAAYGSLDAMTLLLDKGADVNARSATGATALMWSATDLAKVRLLVDRGADVNVESDSGRTALLLAAMSDQSADIVKLLLGRKANAKAVDKEGTTTTLAAAFGNDTATLQQLLEAGADANLANRIGQTPLMAVATQGNEAAAKLLLAKGAQVNAVSAPPGEKVKNGTINLGRFTPLILSSTYGPVSLVKTLLDAGADINAREARGMTPLMYSVATDHGDLAIVKLLVSRGADLSVKTPEGETALDWALKSGSTTEVAELRRAGAVPSPASSHAASQAAPVGLEPAVERGVSILERSSGSFFVNGACGACHAQNVTDFAVMAAKAGGFAINDTAAAQRAGGAAAAFGATASRLLERFDGPAVDILLYTMGGFAAAGYPADRSTDALVFNIAAQQWRDGRWHIGGLPRPPIEDGDFTRTALGVRALRTYGPPGRGAEMRDRVARGVAWLRNEKPRSTEDHAFRLFGLSWGGVDPATLRSDAQSLARLQRTDGGWGQRPEMPSDAYATGLVIFALRATNALPATDPAIERGIKYLLSTQRADGSWFVRSRSPKFQPYFESGFPYGHDQWISAMATGWATAALGSQPKPAAQKVALAGTGGR
jgi:ankyrin repeat protein